ncbi:MAG: sigma-70 family RNA polymerase sigma factor [Prevotella sp.]|nr:sigma-70 family RNA polymerase sigma factor [Prevotella sp.]
MTVQEFEHIALTLRPQLMDVARGFFADEAKAEDVVQDVLLRLWQMRDRIDCQKNVHALAVRMTENRCVSVWRHERAGQNISVGELSASERSVTANIQECDSRRMLNDAIARLNDSERRLLKMRHEQEMDIGQITATTGMAARTVSVMLIQKRNKLLDILKKGGFYE